MTSDWQLTTSVPSYPWGDEVWKPSLRDRARGYAALALLAGLLAGLIAMLSAGYESHKGDWVFGATATYLQPGDSTSAKGFYLLRHPLRLVALFPYSPAAEKLPRDVAARCALEPIGIEPNRSLGHHPDKIANYKRTFRDPCTGAVFDAAGKQVSGPPIGNLHRLPVRVKDRVVSVDISSEPCWRAGEPRPCIMTTGRVPGTIGGVIP